MRWCNRSVAAGGEKGSTMAEKPKVTTQAPPETGRDGGRGARQESNTGQASQAVVAATKSATATKTGIRKTP